MLGFLLCPEQKVSSATTSSTSAVFPHPTFSSCLWMVVCKVPGNAMPMLMQLLSRSLSDNLFTNASYFFKVNDRSWSFLVVFFQHFVSTISLQTLLAVRFYSEGGPWAQAQRAGNIYECAACIQITWGLTGVRHMFQRKHTPLDLHITNF